MAIAILSLGTELVRGELLNTNARWLAEAVSDAALQVSEIACVADDRLHIIQSLTRLARSNDMIICSGGLGPTTDDLTTEAVADLLGEALVLDERSLAHIKLRFERLGRRMDPSNEKQARFPKSAVIVDNPAGTAPGFSVELGRARAYFLPGVPGEMRTMFDLYVKPELYRTRTDYLHQVRLNTFGFSEAMVNDKLAGIESEFGVQLGYRAHFPEIQVKVLARAASLASAEQTAGGAALEVRRRLGEDVVYSDGNTTLAQVVGALLEASSRMLAVAESCTGGLVAELFTTHSGASAHFAGGVVCYANHVKERVLGVPSDELERYGAVSQPVAEAMARGACRALGVTLALAITGVAGPAGGSADKPVGLVHLVVVDNDRLTHQEASFFGTRQQIQRRAAFTGLSMLRRALMHPAT